MKGDPGVIDYLNKALRSELTAISQYWLHYRLQDDWGLGRLARKSRAESIEEMNHADRLMDRIIFLEGFPNLQTLDPLRIGESAKETLECDLAAERDARTLYKEAREHCERVGDYVSKTLFEELMADEEGHIDYLETQLDLIARIGEPNWAQINALPVDEVDDKD
jgi:bacterioferritin